MELKTIISEKEIKEAIHKAYVLCGHNAYFDNGFRRGVEFALNRSKAPEFYEDAKNDLELFDELLRSLPLGLQHLVNAIKERKKEKQQLIKEATEIK